MTDVQVLLEVIAEREAQVGVLPDLSVRARFLAAIALGTARIFGGDAATGTEAVHEAVRLAENSAEVRDDPRLLPWLTTGPLFLRPDDTGRSLLGHALQTARSRAAVGVLPFALNLIARDQATMDRWAVAQATYQEAIDLARESGSRPSWLSAWPGWPGCTHAGAGKRKAGPAPPKR